MKRLKSNGGLTESLLIITGTMGAGKTAVLAEASDILAQRGIVHAAFDLDALGLAHLPSAARASAARSDGVMYDNLRSICRNHAALGVQRFLVARAIEDSAQLKLCRDIIPAVNSVVCRLTSSVEAMERRVQIRDSGISQRESVRHLRTESGHCQPTDSQPFLEGVRAPSHNLSLRWRSRVRPHARCCLLHNTTTAFRT